MWLMFIGCVEQLVCKDLISDYSDCFYLYVTFLSMIGEYESDDDESK